MDNFNGHIIYKSIHPEGDAIVVEQEAARYLYFGNGPLQSAMSLNQPEQLKLTYTQSMMGFLLFRPPPKRCLSLGLGGGALVKFLLATYPDIHIDTVEIREDVVRIAHSQFFLPHDKRLTIHISDAHTFLEQAIHRSAETYDVIFVDIYNQHGLALNSQQSHFFTNCLQLLNSEGILTLNMWASSTQQLQQQITQLQLLTQKKPLCLPVVDRGNIIVFLPTKNSSIQELKKNKPLAKQLEKQLSVPFTRYLKDLIKHNSQTWLQRLLKKTNTKHNGFD